MKRCIALLNDGWADWESGPVLGGLREYLGFTVAIATPRGDAATSIGGVRALGDLGFGAVASADFDVLLVIGSDEWSAREFPEVSALLRQAVAARKVVGAICAATLAAAHAGILDARQHTSNNLRGLVGVGAAYGGKAYYRDVAHAVADGGVVTAAGTAATTFAAEIFRLAGGEKGAEIASKFLAVARAEFG